jgi:photosystem II stability/assembly factor-like uncharacterized protein
MKKELYPLLVAITMLLTTSLCAQWVEKNNGLWGGRAHAFAVDGDNIFAGTEGGVFFSSNNGATWTPRSVGLTSLRIRALAIAGSNIFAATRDGGVFRSSDKGISWTAVNTGLGFGGIYVTVNALIAKGTNLFAALDSGGVFRSSDNGATWTSVGVGGYAFAVIGENIFAGAYGYVMLSTDNGTSWTALNTGLPNKDVQALAVSGSNIFAGTEGGGVFRSTNNGTSWAAVNSGLSNLVVNTLVVNGSDVYAGTDGGMFLSTNNGASWTAINNGLGTGFSPPVHSSVVKGNNIFIGTTFGVSYSANNGANWTSVNTGITGATVWTLLSNGNSIFAGTINESGLYVSPNNAESWQPSNSGISFPAITSSAKIGNNLFVGGAGVFLSTNNGVTWSSVSTGLTNMSVRSLATSGANLFAGTYSGGVFLSTNNGASWNAVNTGLTESNIVCLAASGSNIFAGTYEGLFRSTDNGANWTSEGKAAMQVLNITPYIVSMAVMGSTIFAATFENGLFRSLDNGTSWVKILDEDNIHLHTLDDGSIFAGNTEVFVSTDNGTNWVAAGTGLPKLTSSTIYSMAVTETHLLAGTLFKGVWSRPLSEFPIPQPVVTITSFTPASGPEGTIVTINGTNFSATPSNNSVKFNGTTANVTASTSTSITAIVPAGATTGSIIVTTVRGGSATSSTNFTVTVPTQPEINIKQNNTNIASSGSYAFGNQDIGSASTSVTFTIENTGTGVLNLKGNPKIVISGVNANDFTVNQTATVAEIAAGATTTFTVTFSPITTGSKTAQLIISNNDNDENPYVINLIGTSIAPEINVKVNTASIASAGQYAFGDQIIGITSAAVTFTIENTGTGVLNLTSSPKVIMSGANANEFIVNQPASTAVTSGATITFSVTFSPSTTSSKTAQLSIANNDSDENPYIINLTGTGTCSNPTKPIITQVNNSDFTSSTLTSSSAPVGGTYQWFVNGTAIANASSQSYTTSASGSYSVRITVAGGCSSTSDPFVLVVTGLEPPSLNDDFALYPNPVTDWLVVALSKRGGKKDIAIYQITGNQMTELETLGNEINLYVGDYPPGMYIVKLSTSNSVGVVKFIKK